MPRRLSRTKYDSLQERPPVQPFHRKVSALGVGVDYSPGDLSLPFRVCVVLRNVGCDGRRNGSPALQNNGAEERPQVKNGAQNQESTSSVKAEDEEANRILHKKEEAIKRLEPALEEEERLMREVVQPLDREKAAKWMAQFISAPPLNCPLKQQQEWIEAILCAVERNQIPICKEILALTASIISIESGFRADPLAIDPSRGEDMASLLKRGRE